MRYLLCYAFFVAVGFFAIPYIQMELVSSFWESKSEEVQQWKIMD